MNVKLTDISKASKAQCERFAFKHMSYRGIDAPTNDYLLIHKVTEFNWELQYKYNGMVVKVVFYNLRRWLACNNIIN